IYPILKLPPEITSEIFLLCARATTRGPLGVASVCKAWRSIALATPALWNDFWATGMQNRNLHHLLQCWLPRAGGPPLTLRYIRMVLTQDAILASLAPYASLWMSLDLDASFEPIVFPIGSILTPLSSLKVLTINVHGWPADAPTCMTAFIDAPQLREVNLAGIGMAKISLPWPSSPVSSFLTNPLTRW
ncbi:hypothetical protein C8J57DRAFT_1045599, partial [Mycena rebaudengoi]